MSVEDFTRWDSPKSDPIGDMRRMIERERNRPYCPTYCCEINGHIVQYGNPTRCIVCLKNVEEE